MAGRRDGVPRGVHEQHVDVEHGEHDGEQTRVRAARRLVERHGGQRLQSVARQRDRDAQHEQQQKPRRPRRQLGEFEIHDGREKNDFVQQIVANAVVDALRPRRTRALVVRIAGVAAAAAAAAASSSSANNNAVRWQRVGGV